MSFFDAILSSLNDPSRDTDKNHLESVLTALSGQSAPQVNGAPVRDDKAQELAGAIGNFLKPLLQQTRATQGAGGVQELLTQLSGQTQTPQQIGEVVGPEKAEDMVESASRRTGLDSSLIWKLLPVVLPAVVQLLQSGRQTTPPPLPSQGTGVTPTPSNPILSQFLDSDGDGDVDFADAVKLASQYLGKR